MFDQPFYNRLKEFAAMYGYEEEGAKYMTCSIEAVKISLRSRRRTI